jgi:uncharacterized protein (TIGR03435 family)
MNPNEQNVEKVLENSLPSASKEQAAQAIERVYARLQSDEGVMMTPVVNVVPVRRFNWVWAPAMGAVAALLLVGLWIGLSQRNALAVVESGNISLNESVVTSEGHGAIRLEDGSRVELRAKTELVLERADDGIRLLLNKGGLIVNAAKQSAGHHLYVQTKDLTVSVVGTVFLVNVEEEGSRVAVIEGEVHVRQGGTLEKLLPGEQVVTGSKLPSLPVKEEVQWSPNAEAHVALLQQSTPPPAPKRLQFEVVSIRPASILVPPSPTSPGDPIPPNGGAPACMASDGPVGSPRLTVGLGRCTGRVSLLWLVSTAYDKLDNRASQRISGGPDWTADFSRHGFEINALAENPATVTKEEMRQMLRSMLEDRFKLRVSIGTRETDGYVLSPAKNGLKLQEASVNFERDGLGTSRFQSGDSTVWNIRGKATLSEFVALVSDMPPLVFGPTQSKLEKEGLLFFSLSYAVPMPVPGTGGRSGGSGGALLESAPAYGPVREALRDQLGIDVSIGKVQEKFIVIEHAELPTEN